MSEMQKNVEANIDYLKLCADLKRDGFTEERLNRILENRRRAWGSSFERTHWPHLIALAKLGLKHLEEQKK